MQLRQRREESGGEEGENVNGSTDRSGDDDDAQHAVVGIDVGVRHFLTDSDGRQIENPRYYEKTLERIRKLQRELSRKQKGSQNREKARLKLAKAYRKLVNQRDDFLHKLSRWYVNRYDVIAVEDLQIRNMVRRGGTLARRILDASWRKFFQMLAYKAESAGKLVIRVHPAGTSVGLSWDDSHRDYISACRIKHKASLSGLGRPLAPMERRPLHLVPARAVIEGHVFARKWEAPPVVRAG